VVTNVDESKSWICTSAIAYYVSVCLQDKTKTAETTTTKLITQE